MAIPRSLVRPSYADASVWPVARFESRGAGRRAARSARARNTRDPALARARREGRDDGADALVARGAHPGRVYAPLCASRRLSRSPARSAVTLDHGDGRQLDGLFDGGDRVVVGSDGDGDLGALLLRVPALDAVHHAQPLHDGHLRGLRGPPRRDPLVDARARAGFPRGSFVVPPPFYFVESCRV